MNKLVKVIMAIMGGCSVLFSLFSPIAVTLLWVLQFGSEELGSNIIILLGFATTIYRAIDFLFIKGEYYE